MQNFEENQPISAILWNTRSIDLITFIITYRK